MLEFYSDSRVKMYNNDVNYKSIVLEANDTFKAKGISITKDMADILGSETLFTEYVNILNNGFEDASKKEQMVQLFENSRLNLLQEGSVNGITQVSSLTMPLIRKIWAKVALTNAIPTEVMTKPRISIPFMKTYLVDPDGNKSELPEALYKNKAKYNKRVQTTALSVTKAEIEAGAFVIAADAEKEKKC
jgi:hypothetical protein